MGEVVRLVTQQFTDAGEENGQTTMERELGLPSANMCHGVPLLQITPLTHSTQRI